MQQPRSPPRAGWDTSSRGPAARETWADSFSSQPASLAPRPAAAAPDAGLRAGGTDTRAAGPQASSVRVIPTSTAGYLRHEMEQLHKDLDQTRKRVRTLEIDHTSQLAKLRMEVAGKMQARPAAPDAIACEYRGRTALGALPAGKS